MVSRPSPWRLLHPKWLLLHLFVIAVCVAMVWLGRWQWGAAHRHHGEIRNYAYAFQWWAFTGFALLMWWRVVRDFLSPDGSRPRAPEAAQPSRYVGYAPPQRPADDDPERARFNAYLARLDAAARATEATSERATEETSESSTERRESR